MANERDDKVRADTPRVDAFAVELDHRLWREQPQVMTPKTCQALQDWCNFARNLERELTVAPSAVARSAPTEEMIEAGKNERMACFNSPLMSVGEALTRIYKAMAARAPQSATAFIPTHKHAEGGLYQVIAAIKIKTAYGWRTGVRYRNAEGMEFARSEQEFNARFIAASR